MNNFFFCFSAAQIADERRLPFDDKSHYDICYKQRKPSYVNP